MIRTVLVAFLAVVLLYALLVSFKNVKNNMIESFEEPTLKVCLWKAEWCGHCRQYLKSHVFEDTYASIKDDYPSVVFVTYDYDQNKKLAEEYQIQSFPSIIAVNHKGELVDTFEGDRNDPKALVAFVKKNM